VNLDVSKGEVCYEVAVQKIDRPVGMHIHEREAGKSGDVVVPLTTPQGERHHNRPDVRTSTPR
jgi:CHRD domain-containing protein